ncbi:hypothetical protein ACI2LM_33205 [Paenibacillus lautus]|uniref:hypothetical protein n=1 Tax=Paenibacillus lautus TaxID=1401 RepID=UPI00385006D2
MDIRVIPIDQINAAAYNPRVNLQPGDPEYEKLKRSIEEFGYVEPIVWNERTGNMVGGIRGIRSWSMSKAYLILRCPSSTWT